jgi:hypothetical protein
MLMELSGMVRGREVGQKKNMYLTLRGEIRERGMAELGVG